MERSARSTVSTISVAILATSATGGRRQTMKRRTSRPSSNGVSSGEMFYSAIQHARTIGDWNLTLGLDDDADGCDLPGQSTQLPACPADNGGDDD